VEFVLLVIIMQQDANNNNGRVAGSGVLCAIRAEAI
jgi:hypothetical protein